MVLAHCLFCEENFLADEAIRCAGCGRDFVAHITTYVEHARDEHGRFISDAPIFGLPAIPRRSIPIRMMRAL